MRGVFAATHLDIKPSANSHSSTTTESGHGHHHTHEYHSHTHAVHHTTTPSLNPHLGPSPMPWSEHQRGFTEIAQLISTSALPSSVQEMAIRVFRVLGEAEAEIHGTSLDEVHFHEVGAVDSILDIVGFCCTSLLNITSIKVGAIPLSMEQSIQHMV